MDLLTGGKSWRQFPTQTAVKMGMLERVNSLSNAQIDKFYTREMINAFLELGEEYPEIAGEIYIVASL